MKSFKSLLDNGTCTTCELCFGVLVFDFLLTHCSSFTRKSSSYELGFFSPRIQARTSSPPTEREEVRAPMSVGSALTYRNCSSPGRRTKMWCTFVSCRTRAGCPRLLVVPRFICSFSDLNATRLRLSRYFIFWLVWDVIVSFLVFNSEF